MIPRPQAQKNLTDDLNMTASNLTAQVRSIAQVARAAERGDPSQQITVEAKGQGKRSHQADTAPANGTVRHLTPRTTPGRQGEVDLPNSSQAV